MLNSMTVMRQGPSVDTDFASVALVDAATGVQLGISRVLDSNHSATVGSAITIPAGTSKTFWVVGNIAAAPNTGDIASFAVTAVNTNSTVSGALPIVGASNTINSGLTIGTATMQTSSYDPNAATSQPIGTTGYRFSGVRIQAGSVEDLTFKSITWYQAGSASGLQNLTTMVNGTSYPTVADANGRYYTSVFPAGIVIPKGQSVDVYLTGDLGANTTASTVAEFDIYRNTDIYLVGNQYGYGVTPTGTGSGVSTSATHASAFATSNTAQPYFQGSTVSVTAGQFSTIQNATSVGAQNIAVNVPNQPLGGFQTNLTGESIIVQSLPVYFTLSSALSAAITNVTLVNENGQVVAGPYDATSTNLVQGVIFSGSITFPTGTHTYTLKGQIPSSATNGVTVIASTNPSGLWTGVTGNTTGNTVSVGVSTFNMNTMTIRSALLTVGNSATPTSQTVVAGGSNVIFANAQLDASQSGEDLRLSSVPMKLYTNGLSSNLSNCQLWNGTTALNTGSRVLGTSLATSSSNTTTNGAVTATFSLDNALTVPKGTVLNLGVSCSLSSGATAAQTYEWSVSSTTADWSVTGYTSGATATITVASGNGPIMTVSGNASLVGSTDTSAPSYTIVAGGTTGATANVIKFRASNEPVNLQKVGLTLTSASSSASDLSTVYLYAGNNIMTTAGATIAAGTLLGTASFTGTGATATSTLNTTIQLPRDTDATIVVKADIADIGSSQPGTEGHLVAVDLVNAQGVGANSGQTVNVATLTGSGSAGLRTFNTIPTVSLDSSLGSTGLAGGTLMEFKVTADSHGPVGLDQMVFNIASTSGVSITNVQLYAYTDSNYSSLVSGTFGDTTGQFGSTASTIVSGTNFTLTAVTNPLEIPAGSTYYFKLTASVGGAVSGSSATTKLVGDAAYPSLSPGLYMGTTTGVISGFGGNTGKFVWSPNATTTATTASNDWTNGYGILGLPATGLIKTISQ
jgi:hypothetical protein